MLWNKVIGAGGVSSVVPDGIFETAFTGALGVRTLTMSNANIGAPAANRYIAVIASDYNAAGTDVVSIKVNGITTTLQTTGISGGALRGAIGLIPYPTGTTATIFIDYGATIVRGTAAVYAVYGATTLHSYNSDAAAGRSTGVQGYSVETGDFVLGSLYVVSTTASVTGLHLDSSFTDGGRLLTANSYGPSLYTGTFNYSWSWSATASYGWQSYVLR